MILTGSEIEKEIKNGNIEITPFDKNKINPNSYNLTLNKSIAVYENKTLDCKKHNKLIYRDMDVYEDGYLLMPFNLYLCRTNEITFTDKYVPIISGRSSIGRLGISVHITAGFGDIGFKGTWTLEIFTIQPVIIYPNIEIAQIYFQDIKGDTEIKYQSKYQNQSEIKESLLYKDFK
jgi:dCTP deaminase